MSSSAPPKKTAKRKPRKTAHGSFRPHSAGAGKGKMGGSNDKEKQPKENTSATHPEFAGAPARAVAARIVAAVVHQSQDLDSAIANHIPAQWDSRDRGLTQRLAYGSLRWLPVLRFFAVQLLSKPLARKEHTVEALLWVGLLQLWHEQMPSHAVVHSTVAATQLLERPWAKGLVNACLRRFLREKNELQLKLQQDEARYALPPDWLVQLRQDWPQHWEDIVLAAHAEPPFWLRVNRRRVSREQYLEQLSIAQLGATPGAPPDALCLDHACPVDQLPGFTEGLVAVQDGAAQWAVEALDLQPGLRVLDACAAPGGKTCHILERQPELSHLLALDRDPQRVARIHQNLERLGLNGPQVQVRCADASEPASWAPDEGFDRILLDAPCSASGVVRRHPDIPWRRQLADITHLNRLQAQLLQQLWPLLRPGGILVYVTCSIFASENQQQIQNFLRDEASAQALPLPPWGVARGVGRQCLPGVEGMDGFFYAALRRRLDERLPSTP